MFYGTKYQVKLHSLETQALQPFQDAAVVCGRKIEVPPCSS